MPASKIVYTKAELFTVRDRMCDSLESSGAVTPALPAFGAVSPVVPQQSPLGEQQGSIRENLFGASAHSSRRLSSSAQQALPTSTSGTDLGSVGIVPTPAVDALWAYRTKGGGKISNAMPLKDIQQLVADELVDEDDIELRLADGGEGVFMCLSDAIHAATHLQLLAASGSLNSSANAVLGTGAADTTCSAVPAATERWRPGGAVSRQAPRAPASGLGPTQGGSLAAPMLRGNAQLPPKHLNISRDEMMATEEHRRKSPSAVSPPAHSPAAATILPSPIDIVAPLDVESADLGLGTVPTPTASVPLPPCGLGSDRPIASISVVAAVPVAHSKATPVKGGQITPVESPSKYGLRNGPPPPISSVDSAPMAPPPAFGAQLHEPLEAAAPVAVAVEPSMRAPAPAAVVEPSVVSVAGINDPSVLSIGRVVSGSGGSATSPQSKVRGDKRRNQQAQATTVQQHQPPVQPAVALPTPVPHPPVVTEVPARHIDPAPSATKPVTTNAPATAVGAKQSASRPNAWSTSATGKENGGKSHKGESRRRSANTSNTQSPNKKSPAAATATGANPDLYPSLEEVLKGAATPAAAKAPRQPVTLASIVAGSGHQQQPTGTVAAPSGTSTTPTVSNNNNTKKHPPPKGKGKSNMH